MDARFTALLMSALATFLISPADEHTAEPETLQSVTTGTNNIALGKDALGDNATGNNNTAIGEEAMRFIDSGSGNIAIGRRALSDFDTLQWG